MIESTLHEGTQPHRVGCQFRRYPGNAIGHLHIQGDEIETLDVFPRIEMGVNHIGVTVKGFGEQTLLLGRTESVLLEEFVLSMIQTFFD